MPHPKNRHRYYDPAVGAGSQGPPPVVLSFTPASGQAAFTAGFSNMSVDVLELGAGTYTWQSIQVNVDRTARPLLVRPAIGAVVNFVGPATTDGTIFMLGNTSRTKKITFDGSYGTWTFKDFQLASSGVWEPRDTDFITLRGMTFQNIARDGGFAPNPFNSWIVYASGAGSGGTGSNNNLLIETMRLKAPAVSRDISAFQVASSGNHGTVTIRNILEMVNYDYGFAADRPVSNLTLDTWSMTNVGNSPTPASIRFFAVNINGIYKNITATGSDPLLNNSTGVMSNGGGNSGI